MKTAAPVKKKASRGSAPQKPAAPEPTKGLRTFEADKVYLCVLRTDTAGKHTDFIEWPPGTILSHGTNGDIKAIKAPK